LNNAGRATTKRGLPLDRTKRFKKQSASDHLMSRRNFLRLSGGVIGAGLAGRLLRPRPLAAAGVLPPGAQSGVNFETICLRCGKCAAICDQQAIKLSTDGIPYIDGISGWCDFCMDCASVCPSGALQTVDPVTSVIATAVINRDRCIAWQRLGCRLCAAKCEKLRQAIWIDEDWHPHVDASLCNGCGACVFVCPQATETAGNRKRGKAVSLQRL
jgi:ferredoxin-type protein NapF